MNNNRGLNQKGQDLVEFALILPLFLLIIMMIFDFGRAVYYYSVVHNAAREGARYGIILSNPEAGIEGAAQSLMIGLGCTDITINYERVVDPSDFCPRSNAVCVEVTCSYIPATPLVGNFLDSGSLTLIGRSEMNLEGILE
jgi:hypothetical protein